MSRQIDSLQFVMFVASNVVADVDQKWQSLFAAVPETSARLNPTFSHAVGKVGPFQVALVLQPGRVDITIAGYSGEPKLAYGPPPVADTKAAVKLGLKAIKAASSGVDVIRVAFVLQASVPVQNIGEAIVEVLRQAPQLPSPADATDILYQVNVPMPSASVSGRFFNRICRWNTGKKMLVQLGGSPQAAEQIVAADYIDISTIDRSPLPNPLIGRVHLASLYKEMTVEAQRILAAGYAAL